MLVENTIQEFGEIDILVNNAFTKSLCHEAINKGIRVNAVSPGPVWTPLNTYGSPPDKMENFGADSLLKRPAQPIELAPIFMLLASDEASYIVGEIYGVTGGEIVK